jgi:hypothetical protein
MATANNLAMNAQLKAAFLGVLVALNSGCVVVPALKFGGEPEVGSKLKVRDIAFIVPGETKRAEVIERLGTSFRKTPQTKAIAYSWEIPGGDVGLGICAEGGCAGWEWEISRWRAVFIDFDSREVVARKAIVRLRPSKSLDEQLEKWVARK